MASTDENDINIVLIDHDSSTGLNSNADKLQTF
jgi:hypothetical protein